MAELKEEEEVVEVDCSRDKTAQKKANMYPHPSWSNVYDHLAELLIIRWELVYCCFKAMNSSD